MSVEHIDQVWIDDFRVLSAYPNSFGTKLRTVKDAGLEKAIFVESGFTVNPNLKPDVDKTKVAVNQVGLRYMIEAVEDYETDKVVRAAYIPRLGELVVFLSMLEASAKGDTDRFIACNVQAYGEPRKRELNTCLSYFHSFIDEQLDDSASAATKVAALQAKDVLPEPSGQRRRWPASAEFYRVKELYRDFYDEILSGIDLPEKATSEEVFRIAEKALKNLGYMSYKVTHQEEGVSTFSVSHNKKQVKVPKKQEYERERLQGLLGHEIKIHVEERINGEKAPLQILYSGLAKYLKGSEGKGVLTEQVAYDSIEEFQQTRRYFDIARRYLAIALARGTDGNGPRDFKEVFKIMNSIDLLDELSKNPENMAAATMKSVERTWELLAKRALRGWTGRGAAAFKDKVYLEGNLDQWKVLITNPQIFPYLNKGKYDASRPEHLFILQEIGLIPGEILNYKSSETVK